MSKSLWGGRFEKALSPAVLSFNSAENLQLDAQLIPYDIAGSIAHVLMLKKQKILSSKQSEAILAALLTIKLQYEKGVFTLKPEFEDVHMNVEHAVTAITPHGKAMHTARSRNDQVMADMRLYLRDQILEVASAIVQLQKAFIASAKKNEIMPAYTHTRIAQPISTSFWADAYVQAFSRDIDRLFELYGRVNANPLGACACAGTSWPIDRSYTAELLGFDSIQENELDTISSRGELEGELLGILSLAAVKLSRIAEELLWFSEKGFVAIPEEFTTGSSIMPQKKNADVLELIRGRSGRVFAAWVHTLTALKGTISGYNSDSQETKYAIMQGIATTLSSLHITAAIVHGIQFNEKAMREALEKNFAQATALADALAQKGVAFRDAHEAAGKLVRLCEKKGKTLTALTPEEIRSVTPILFSAKELSVLLQFRSPQHTVDIAPIQNQQKLIEEKQAALKKTYEALYRLAKE